jgi:hypothetical protein
MRWVVFASLACCLFLLGCTGTDADEAPATVTSGWCADHVVSAPDLSQDVGATVSVQSIVGTCEYHWLDEPGDPRLIGAVGITPYDLRTPTARLTFDHLRQAGDADLVDLGTQAFYRYDPTRPNVVDVYARTEAEGVIIHIQRERGIDMNLELTRAVANIALKKLADDTDN